MLRRPALFASLAVAMIGGCAASRSDRYPSPIAGNPPSERVSVAIAEAVNQHNRNAEKVDHVQSIAAVSTTSRLLSGAGKGIVEFERPRNFRFQIEAGFRKQVDIGSNDDEFWFWSKDNKNPMIYKCRYETLPESAEQPPFQPEWIIESMGLYVIPESEMQQIRIDKNVRPGVDMWTSRRPFGHSTTMKVTLVDQQTGRFLEHRFYNPTIKNPIAVVTPGDFKELKTADGATVVLPQKLHLKIASDESKQAMDLDLALSGSVINTAIAASDRVSLFEPQNGDISPNAQVYYLDDKGVARTKGEGIAKPQKRQSLSEPPVSNAPAQLGEPSPFNKADDSSFRRSDPMPREANELPMLPEGTANIIGPNMPQPPGNRVPQIAGVPTGVE